MSAPPAGAPARTRPRLARNVVALSVVSLLTDVSSEIIYPLLPIFLTSVLGAGAGTVGVIEGAAESTAALLKLASGWWSDRVTRRTPLVLAGYSLSSLARPVVALAQSAGQVLAIRLADRVGKGVRTSPRDALIADSVDPVSRGWAFGVHRAADHAGAVIGPLVAFSLLQGAHLPLRHVFAVAAVPAALAVVALLVGVREAPRVLPQPAPVGAPRASVALGRRFWAYLAVLLIFTLGNSTDAFILLRASQLGIATALVPLLWAMLHAVKAVASVAGGWLSDRVGRRRPIVAGWLVYAAVYLAFGRATAAWQGWALFAVYGLYFGLTEGVEKALVTDLVPTAVRGIAFGWYNLTLGLAALPASAIFGVIWDRAGAAAAFEFGAAMAVAAAVGLAIVLRGLAPPRAPGG